MHYKDLVNFEKIIDVIQLKQADNRKKAENLVRTYVVSDGMAEKLSKLVFPHIQFENPKNNKGLLIVGNYGTGKSHLMSVISVIAEEHDMLNHLNSDKLKESSQSIAGKFKVIREEVGSTQKKFRDLICDILTKKLDDMGVSFEFPPYDQVTNHKDLFAEMMSRFEEKYPDQGLLLVIDELLDYLRTRKDQELILDLNFLREMGEVSDITRFRFIGGIQEALFDNPRFSFANESIRRVKDRFEQVRIVREDIEYVISERLLKKDEQHKKKIIYHLSRFTVYYENLNERMDKFVSLFPVHPAFIETFERVYIAEKREILRTISQEIELLLNEKVPEDSPGLISYDSYWKYIDQNPSLQSIPDIKEVVEKSRVLTQKLEQSFPKKVYKPAAKRIIQALSIHRLTTGDIYSKLGVTSLELKDDLFLFLQIPEPGSDFLKGQIDVILKDILLTVNRQFISQNTENGQYYLDLKKDIDFDAIIEQKIPGLDDDILNRYYFEVLKQLTEKTSTSYVTGFNIWEHELLWIEKKVTRKGYLFFGTPDDRSTAQPPRDFYIYFLSPFGERFKIKDSKDDEVYFTLESFDEKFESFLKLYASSQELCHSSISGNKKIYQEKADIYRRKLTHWLSDNILTAFSSTYKGNTLKAAEWLKKGRYTDASTFLEVVDSIGSICLTSYFEEKYPEYPAFSEKITFSNTQMAAQEAVSSLSGGLKTKQAQNVFAAFDLLDSNGAPDPKHSKYARYFIDMLDKKGRGQVINRNEIIDGSDPRVEKDYHFKLEPEWIGVVLTSLIYSGYIELATSSGKIDVGDLTGLKSLKLDEIKNFKYFQKPKELPIAELKVLFKLLGIAEGLITSENDENQKSGVKQMIEKADLLLNATVMTLQKIDSGIYCWGMNLLDATKTGTSMKKLQELQEFLQTIQKYHKVSLLNNITYTVKDIEKLFEAVDIQKNLDLTEKVSADMLPFTAYLSAALEKLTDDSQLKQKIITLRSKFAQDISLQIDPESMKEKWIPLLKELKNEYIEEYFYYHKKYRLNPTQDERKKKIMESDLFKSLSELSKVDMIDKTAFFKIRETLIEDIKTCFTATKKELEQEPSCPYCRFNPTDFHGMIEVSQKLDECENRLDDLYENWREALYNNLSDPFVGQSIELMEMNDQKVIKSFIESRKLPDKIDSVFVKALNEVLKGLEKVEVDVEDIKEALIKGGAVCNPGEIKERFEAFVDDLMKGKSKDKVRILIKS